MSDQPPRVRITLPGDAPARLAGWRQGPDGRWWGLAEVYVPATAVQKVPGEDYRQVPREEASVPAVEYVLATDTRDKPPAVELHLATCWEISQPARWRRITPVQGADVARASVRFDDTTQCPTCTPFPDLA
jgi:hypothetical protein